MDPFEIGMLKFFAFVITFAVVGGISLNWQSHTHVSEAQRSCIEACGAGHVAQLPTGDDRCICGAP